MSRAVESATVGVLSEEECRELAERVLEMVGAEQAQVGIASQTTSGTKFTRGEAHMGSETHTVTVGLLVEGAGQQAQASTDQLDEAGLRALVTEVEALSRDHRTPQQLELMPRQVYPEGPQIFFDATVDAMAGTAQAEVFRIAAEEAEVADLIAAGDLFSTVAVRAGMNTRGLWGYERSTYGQFSMTARTKEGTGSGWAWGGYENWARVDTAAVIGRAIDLAARSAKPVAVEPGRYAVILEPAAVAELIQPIIGFPTGFWDAFRADGGSTVFSNEPLGTNKIGLQMMDRRLAMVSDPWDPERPASVISSGWRPLKRVGWFEEGVLRNLAYASGYARQVGVRPVINPGGVRLAAEGPPQTLEEMIASTRRGVWVNRLSHVGVMDQRTLLLTGTTRDGTFLIENGKITKPIKNFRFTESPFFVFNQLEAWGEPVRASQSVVAPRLKLRDFNFTSLTDAI